MKIEKRDMKKKKGSKVKVFIWYFISTSTQTDKIKYTIIGGGGAYVLTEFVGIETWLEILT